MRRFVLTLAAAAALVYPAAASAHPQARPAIHVVAAKSCSAGYVKGTIGGAVKCLRAGEYCSLRYKSQYLQYGFVCSGSPARLHKR